MVTEWLEWARGPAFRFSIALMILGLFRLMILNTSNILDIMSRSRGRSIPWKSVLGDTANWLFPYKKMRPHAFFAITSFVFHVAVIVTPVFLAAHIELWRRGTGAGWAAIPQAVADYMTWIAIAAAGVLFAKRASARVARALSRPQDYLLPLLIMIPFVSGYLAAHPGVNPFDYSATMLVHVLSGNVVLVLIPFTKLSHAVLFPTTQLMSEMAWHLSPGSGKRVAVTLGKENEPV